MITEPAVVVLPPLALVALSEYVAVWYQLPARELHDEQNQSGSQYVMICSVRMLEDAQQQPLYYTRPPDTACFSPDRLVKTRRTRSLACGPAASGRGQARAAARCEPSDPGRKEGKGCERRRKGEATSGS